MKFKMKEQSDKITEHEIENLKIQMKKQADTIKEQANKIDDLKNQMKDHADIILIVKMIIIKIYNTN